MSSRGQDDDTTREIRLPATAQPEDSSYASDDHEPRTIIAPSPSASMLLVADPTEVSSDEPGLPHPADDAPGTLVTRAPPESRPRIPTPRMDLRMYTPASTAPSALTLPPPTPSSSSLARAPLPFPHFDVRPPRESRVHPIAWVAVGVLLGAGAMAAILSSRDDGAMNGGPTNAAPTNANVSAETNLDKIAPMPSASATPPR
jgi:hypothetical protein